MKRMFPGVVVACALALLLASCSGGGSQPAATSTATQPTVAPATVYITGSDAPLPSVLAFQITINSLSLSDGANTVQLLSEPTTLEFSRLLGLRALLALGSVNPGAYTSVTVSLASPVISYLDLSTTPASVGTINGTLTSSTITKNLPVPLTVASNGLGGLHFHFDLRDSLAVDGAGNITGSVNPHIGIRALQVDDDDAQIDELHGGLVSTNTADNSFVIQRSNGRQLTIRVNSQTQWDGTTGLAAMATPAIIEVSGKIQADGSLLADHVELTTSDRNFLAGLVLDAAPASGAASSLTLLVREEMPPVTGMPVGFPAKVNIGATTVFNIYRFGLPVDQLLFNSSELVRGQRIAIGGVADTTVNPPVMNARRILLHRQGLDGSLNPGSVVITSGNNGSFTLVANGFFGYLFGAPLKVMTSSMTRFINVSGLSALDNGTAVPLRVVGLLLKDSGGNPVLVAGAVIANPEQ